LIIRTLKKLLRIDEDYDFSIIGISCHAKDYRLSWSLNQTLNIDLEKSESTIFSESNDDEMISRFNYYDEDSHIEYWLLSNHSTGKDLIPELPQLDFFLQVSGPQHEITAREIRSKIQQIDLVLAALQVDHHQLKSKESLIF
jgi:hypothetical protein